MRGLVGVVVVLMLGAVVCGESVWTVVGGDGELAFECELSGVPSDFDVRAVPGVDAAPTDFDGVNAADCEFSEEIVSVKVLLFHGDGPVAGLLAYDEVIELSPSRTIVFPVGDVGERKVLDSVLPLGRYTRRMEAATVDGDVVDIRAETGDIKGEIFLVDAPSATAMVR